MDTPISIREGAIFAGVGRKFMESHAESLSCGSLDGHGRPRQDDPRINQVFEMRKLRTDQLFEISTFPFLLDEEVLACGKRANALIETAYEISRLCGGGLPRNSQDKLSMFFER